MAGWKLILILAAVLALHSTTAQAAKPAPRSFFGLVPNHGLQASDYQMIKQANVGSARVSLFWQVIEPRNDQFSWSATDGMIGGFAARGIRTLPQLFGSPDWVAGDVMAPPVGSPAQEAEWMEFVSEAVRRYGPGGTYWSTAYPLQFPGAEPMPIRTWQIWNEENGPKHFYPRPDVNRYATLLRISRAAISGRDPGASILTGGIVSMPTGEGGVPAWRYIRNLLKVGGSFDHVALHPYARDAREITSHIKKVRQALKKGKKKKAQVWITEVGWSSDPSGVSPKLSTTAQGQAQRLASTYNKLKKKRRKWRIGGVYWYTWRDFTGGVCSWCPHAGLVRSDLGPKPAFAAYAGVASDGSPSNELSFGKAKRNKKKGTAKLTVKVPGPGELELAKTKQVKGKEKQADAAGKEKLPIKPKGKAKKKLNRKGKARVKATVTYTPGGGDANTKSKKLGLKKR